MNDDLLVSPARASSASPGVDVMLIVWIVLGMIVVIALVVIIAKIRKYFGRPELHGMSREAIQKHWEEIEKLSESGRMGGKMAIVEADKLLDSSLKSLMMSGSTLGERLKFAGYKYPELRKVWNAHRLRNRLVHETSFEPGIGETRAAIRDFKRALQVLKVL